MMLTATAAWADVVEVNGLRYDVSTGSLTASVIAPAEGVYTGEITIPSSINYNGEDIIVDFISSNAFANATITKVTIPSTVYYIGSQAFYHCESLAEITLPEGLREISVSAFAGCPITSLTLPGTLTTIGSYGLEGLSSLQKLTIAYGAEELSMDWSVFNGTDNVTELVIDRYYTFGNGKGISYNTVKKVTFGEHLTTIPKSVCEGMSLNELNVGANVTAVDSYAFFNCTLPEGCNFPFAQIKEIKDGAFYLTKNLPANLDLTGVETLAENAFANCELQSVILPMTVTSIGNGAFSYVENLKVYAPWLTSPASLANPDSPDSHQQQFYFDKATLYVPAGTMDTYKSLVGWKEFGTIDYWSFNVSATVAGKGSLKMSNGETVHANGTNTEKTVTGTQLVESGAGTPVSGLFVREKDVTFTSTPARGYELSSLTANGTDVKAAGKVANLLADQNIAAEFTPIIYNITYNNLQNGVVDPANPATYTVEDAAITLANPTRTGYTFEGWTGTDIEGTAMEVTIAASSIGDREYTATWKPIVYDITYDLAGGSVATPNLDKYTIETADFTLTNPTKLGYTFLGWTGTELAEPTTEVLIAKGSTGDRSYTATWKANTYKVSFKANGGEGEMADQPFTYDEAAKALTANAFTRTGYTYKGWNTKADGSGTAYEDGQEVKNLTSKADDTVTLYAQWEVITYAISYDLDGGTVDGENPTEYTAESTFTLLNPTKEGYDFTGWTGTGLDKPTMTVVIAKGSTGDRAYKATWELKQYAVTIETTENGTVEASTLTPKHGEQVVITVTPDEGCKLVSLTVNGEDVTEQVVDGKYTIESVTADVTVTAVFAMTLIAGDVNGDGTVGIGDIVAVTNVMAGIEQDGAVKARADVNHDGEVGIGDIVAITNIMAGL